MVSRDDIKGIAWPIIGAILILATGLLGETWATNFASYASYTISDELLTDIQNTCSGLVFTGSIGLALAVLIFCFKIALKRFFYEHIDPLITKHIHALNEKLAKSHSRVHKLVGAGKITTVIEQADPSDVQNHLRLMHAKAFGSHCDSDQSLYHASTEKLYNHLDPKVPHRSGYSQLINVTENPDSTISWCEICSYKLHTIHFDPALGGNIDNEEIQYPFHYGSQIRVDDRCYEEGRSQNFELEIKINDEVIFDAQKEIVVDNGEMKLRRPIDGVVLRNSKNTVNIDIDRLIPIQSAWTKIEIKETSTVLDNYLISSRRDPTFGFNLNITLPQGWDFEMLKFDDKNDWTINTHPENVMSAKTEKWILPGITYFVQWRKPN